jgi:heterodisulfide reductase subunit A-like polyferredoxin
LGSPLPGKVAMILCVGPAERTCARICCTTALKNALLLKRLQPEAQVTILYRDVRAYGFKEHLYTEARRAGVLFVRYEGAAPPEVTAPDGRLQIRLRDPGLGTPLLLEPDVLVLSNPVVPSEGSRHVATALKIPVDADGYFLEAHVKLRPVDFGTEGLFMAGLAHYPKLIDESLVQAKAAAGGPRALCGLPDLCAHLSIRRAAGLGGYSGRGRHPRRRQHRADDLPGLRRLRGRMSG